MDKLTAQMAFPTFTLLSFLVATSPIASLPYLLGAINLHMCPILRYKSWFWG